nr:MAG TPA: hypothetical protein [Inoviridae sp.]
MGIQHPFLLRNDQALPIQPDKLVSPRSVTAKVIAPKTMPRPCHAPSKPPSWSMLIGALPRLFTTMSFNCWMASVTPVTVITEKPNAMSTRDAIGAAMLAKKAAKFKTHPLPATELQPQKTPSYPEPADRASIQSKRSTPERVADKEASRHRPHCRTATHKPPPLRTQNGPATNPHQQQSCLHPRNSSHADHERRDGRACQDQRLHVARAVACRLKTQRTETAHRDRRRATRGKRHGLSRVSNGLACRGHAGSFRRAQLRAAQDVRQQRANIRRRRIALCCLRGGPIGVLSAGDSLCLHDDLITRISKVRNLLRSLCKGLCLPVRIGDRLGAGDSLRTGDSSRASDSRSLGQLDGVTNGSGLIKGILPIRNSGGHWSRGSLLRNLISRRSRTGLQFTGTQVLIARAIGTATGVTNKPIVVDQCSHGRAVIGQDKTSRPTAWNITGMTAVIDKVRLNFLGPLFNGRGLSSGKAADFVKARGIVKRRHTRLSAASCNLVSAVTVFHIALIFHPLFKQWSQGSTSADGSANKTTTSNANGCIG